MVLLVLTLTMLKQRAAGGAECAECGALILTPLGRNFGHQVATPPFLWPEFCTKEDILHPEFRICKFWVKFKQVTTNYLKYTINATISLCSTLSATMKPFMWCVRGQLTAPVYKINFDNNIVDPLNSTGINANTFGFHKRTSRICFSISILCVCGVDCRYICHD